MMAFAESVSADVALASITRTLYAATWTERLPGG
jgi:hypothetical protein